MSELNESNATGGDPPSPSRPIPEEPSGIPPNKEPSEQPNIPPAEISSIAPAEISSIAPAEISSIAPAEISNIPPNEVDATTNQEEAEKVDKIQSLNENFFYNSMLARALLQILPHRDKKPIRIWLDKLADMDNDEEEIATRHEYMWFLLLMLETKQVRDPFNKLPPKDLVPLNDFVPRNVYEDVLLWNDQTSFAAEKGDESKDKSLGETGPPAKTSSPAKFMINQPVPKKGVICYLAAFSDRDTY